MAILLRQRDKRRKARQMERASNARMKAEQQESPEPAAEEEEDFAASDPEARPVGGDDDRRDRTGNMIPHMMLDAALLQDADRLAGFLIRFSSFEF